MKNLILFAGFFIFLIIVPLAEAKLKVTCDVEEISRHEIVVTLGWKVTVQSDKQWDACDLVISFRDGNGDELFVIRERANVQIGSNYFSGHDICDAKVWRRVKKYVTSFDCVF